MILLFLGRAKTIYCFSILNRSRISCYDIYYVGYLRIWEFHSLILLLCIVTTRVMFRFLITRFFMNELSTLRLIVILLVIISSMPPLLYLLFLLPVDCRFLYQVAFHFSFSFSSWQTLDACSCRIVSLRGDVK